MRLRPSHCVTRSRLHYCGAPWHINKSAVRSQSLVRNPVNFLYSICPARIRDKFLDQNSSGNQQIYLRNEQTTICNTKHTPFSLKTIQEQTLGPSRLPRGPIQHNPPRGTNLPIPFAGQNNSYNERKIKLSSRGPAAGTNRDGPTPVISRGREHGDTFPPTGWSLSPKIAITPKWRLFSNHTSPSGFLQSAHGA
jgi:hypothetical protein